MAPETIGFLDPAIEDDECREPDEIGWVHDLNLPARVTIWPRTHSSRYPEEPAVLGTEVSGPGSQRPFTAPGTPPPAPRPSMAI